MEERESSVSNDGLAPAPVAKRACIGSTSSSSTATPTPPPTAQDDDSNGSGGGSPPHAAPSVPLAVTGGGGGSGGFLPHVTPTSPGWGGGSGGGSPPHATPATGIVPPAIIGGVKSRWGYDSVAPLAGPPLFGSPDINGGAAVGGVVDAESSPLAAAAFNVDKTRFIKELEAVGEYVALHRPRGWGKTTFLNMLDAYYDCANAGAPVVRLTGGGTELAHTFAILRFDFSSVVDAARAAGPDATTNHEKMVALYDALDALVLNAVNEFRTRYAVPADILREPTNPSRCLTAVCNWARWRGKPVYMLVDECDAPLRHNIATYTGTIEEARLARDPMRAFYGRFKVLADSGCVSRIFLAGTFGAGCPLRRTRVQLRYFPLNTATAAHVDCAGIMPLVVSEGLIEPILDVSLEPRFNGVVGFSRSDVSDAIGKCTTYSAGTAGHAAIVEALAQRWGGGYLFEGHLTEAEGMFSPAMVVDVLDVVHSVQAADSFADVLAAWVSSPLRVEPNRAIVGFFAVGHTLIPLLRYLAFMPYTAAPHTLATMTVELQIAAATGVLDWQCVKAKKDAIESTFYYEGMLTHLAAVAGEGAGSARFRVANEQLKRFFVVYATELSNTPY